MSERPRVSYGLANTMPVLDMTAEVTNPRIEDIAEGVLAQEEVADDSHTPSVSVLHPQSPQIGYRVDRLLCLSHVLVKLLKGHFRVLADLADHCAVFFDETDDSLPVVLRDVLGLVLHPLLPLPFPLRNHLLLAALVLRGAPLLSDHPRLFIEMWVVGDLREYGGGGVMIDEVFWFLFLDEAVKHAIVVWVCFGIDVI